MIHEYNDGGRSKYFSDMRVGDCVTRSFSLGLGKDYLSMYELINKIAKSKQTYKISGFEFSDDSTAKDGVYPRIIRMVGKHFDLKFKRKKGIIKDLKGNKLVITKEHMTCVKDGILLDTHDCSDVEYYGYYEL
jgi:hypothetical protein